MSATLWFGAPAIALMAAMGSAAGRADAPDTGREGPAIYLVNGYEADGRVFLHWKYSANAPQWTKVEVAAEVGMVLGVIDRPERTFVPRGVPTLAPVLTITPLTADGLRGAQHRISLVSVPHGGPQWIGRVGVRKEHGRAAFYDRATGGIFHPRGFNWIPLRGDHAAFDAATSTTKANYDPYDAEGMFRVLAANGYNTVRVFLAGRSTGNPGIAGEPGTHGLYIPYLDNLADFLQRGARYGVRTIFNFCDLDLPHNTFFREASGGTLRGNRVVLTRKGLDAQLLYVRSVLGYLKGKNPGLLKAVLAVEGSNEMSYDLKDWPFSERGSVTTANGKTYDMGEPAQRSACGEEGWLYYYEAFDRVVKSIDPEMLTCEGIFVANAVGRDYRKGNAFELAASGDSRCPPSVALLSRARLDFLDIHLYPDGPIERTGQTVQEALASSLYDRAVDGGLLASKPVVLGEFGSFWGRDPDFATACRRIVATRDAACGPEGFTGFLMWTFDSFEQTGLYHAMADDGAFVKRLDTTSPWPVTAKPGKLLRPNECARNPIPLATVAPTGEGKGFLAR